MNRLLPLAVIFSAWPFFLKCVFAQDTSVSPEKFFARITSKHEKTQSKLAEMGNFEMSYQREPGGEMHFVSTKNVTAIWLGHKMEAATHARVRSLTSSFWFSLNEKGQRELYDFKETGVARIGYRELDFLRTTSGISAYLNYIPILDCRLQDLSKFLPFAKVESFSSDTMQKLDLRIDQNKLTSTFLEQDGSPKDTLRENQMLSAAMSTGLTKISVMAIFNEESHEKLEADFYFDLRRIKDQPKPINSTPPEIETVSAAMRVSWQWDAENQATLPSRFEVNKIEGFDQIYESFSIDRLKVQEVPETLVLDLATFALVNQSKVKKSNFVVATTKWYITAALGIFASFLLMRLFFYSNRRISYEVP